MNGEYEAFRQKNDHKMCTSFHSRLVAGDPTHPSFSNPSVVVIVHTIEYLSTGSSFASYAFRSLV